MKDMSLMFKLFALTLKSSGNIRVADVSDSDFRGDFLAGKILKNKCIFFDS